MSISREVCLEEAEGSSHNMWNEGRGKKHVRLERTNKTSRKERRVQWGEA